MNTKWSLHFGPEWYYVGHNVPLYLVEDSTEYDRPPWARSIARCSRSVDRAVRHSCLQYTANNY